MRNLVRTLRACASIQRLRIIKLLSQKRNLAIGDISESLNLTYKNTAKHLTRLLDVGIVDKESYNGKTRYFLTKDKFGITSILLKNISKL